MWWIYEYTKVIQINDSAQTNFTNKPGQLKKISCFEKITAVEME